MPSQPRRVSDIVRDMIPFMRNQMSPQERNLAVHIRGNELLFQALNAVLMARLEGRARLPVPSDPIKSHTRVVADSELRWLIGRLNYLYHSPVVDPASNRGEPPTE